MKCIGKVIVLYVSLIILQTSCMEFGGKLIVGDVFKEIISYLDFSSASALSRTSTKNGHIQSLYSVNEKVVLVDFFVYKNSSTLSSSEHLNCCVHYAQQDNKVMLKHIMTTENDTNKEERRKIVSFFGEGAMQLDSVDDTACAYQGIKKGEIKLNEENHLLRLLRATTGIKDKENNLKIIVKNNGNIDQHVSGMMFKNGHSTFWTILHRAAYAADEEFVSLLIHYGADINAETDDKSTVFDVASPHINVMRLLQEKGACLTSNNKNQKTALHRAIREGSIDAVQFLLNKVSYNVEEMIQFVSQEIQDLPYVDANEFPMRALRRCHIEETLKKIKLLFINKRDEDTKISTLMNLLAIRKGQFDMINNIK